MDDSTKRKIASESSRALHQHVFRHSVSFLRVDKMELASGTLVQIADRVFVATTAHTIPHNADESTIWLLPGVPRQKDEDVPKIINSGKIDSHRPDVAFMELEGDSALSYLEKSACDISRFRQQGIGRPNRLVSLVGSPGNAINHVKVNGSPGINVKVISYSTVPYSEAETPSISAPDTPADLDIDLFLAYPSGSGDTIDLATGDPIKLPDAPGTSGGGIWDQGFDTDKLWSTEDAVCFAIQSRWHETKRYLRAVQIIHWARLVHESYPELRSILESQFPELSS